MKEGSETELINTRLVYRRFGPPTETLQLESESLPPLQSNHLRVQMDLASINPSDLIPITGAYPYHTRLPLVAGYEGVGRVIEASGAGVYSIGQRVLPLRGQGTWQNFVDCDEKWAVPVPDDISNAIASRTYINPLAAYLMLKRWPVKGKTIALTAAGSSCARLLAQWAHRQGVQKIYGLCDSSAHHRDLESMGVEPLASNNANTNVALGRSDIIFDAVGGELIEHQVNSAGLEGTLVSYGALSGLQISASNPDRLIERFHIRDYFDAINPAQWQRWFTDLWSLLRTSTNQPMHSFEFADWKAALKAFETRGRREKTVLSFKR